MNTKQHKKAEKTLQQIAKRDGISIAMVRHEIEIAIAAARENPDPKVQAFWRSVPCKGEFPTPEEAITYLSGMFGKNGLKQ